MKRWIRSIWIGAFSFCMIQAAFAQAVLKDFPQGKWWTNKRVIAELKLSTEQQVRIETLWTQNRRILIDQKAELEKRQLDLAEQLSRDMSEENAALRAFDRMIEARTNLERTTFLMRIQIKKQLSPEQQERLETLSELLRLQKAKNGAAAAAEAGRAPSKK